MDKAEEISVSICYVTSSTQEIIHLLVPVGSTVMQALESPELKGKFQQFDFNTKTIGIHGKIVEKSYVLSEHDRIEIYQPLRMDPMQVRRQRANLQR